MVGHTVVHTEAQNTAFLIIWYFFLFIFKSDIVYCRNKKVLSRENDISQQVRSLVTDAIDVAWQLSWIIMAMKSSSHQPAEHNQTRPTFEQRSASYNAVSPTYRQTR